MPLWLLEATQDDTSTMVTQIVKMKSFLVQVAGSSGKGSISLTHDRADRKTLMCAAKAYAVEITNRNARQEARE